MLREHIYAGMAAWAAWGNTGWSAVRVMTVSRSKKNVKVERVDPKTEKPITRKAKAKISELVKRDPKKKGADKPAALPAEVFAEQRKVEEAKKLEVVKPAPVAVAQPAVEPAKPRTPAEQAARDEDISRYLRETFEKLGYTGTGDW